MKGFFKGFFLVLGYALSSASIICLLTISPRLSYDWRLAYSPVEVAIALAVLACAMGNLARACSD